MQQISEDEIQSILIENSNLVTLKGNYLLHFDIESGNLNDSQFLGLQNYSVIKVAPNFSKVVVWNPLRISFLTYYSCYCKTCFKPEEEVTCVSFGHEENLFIGTKSSTIYFSQTEENRRSGKILFKEKIKTLFRIKFLFFFLKSK